MLRTAVLAALIAVAAGAPASAAERIEVSPRVVDRDETQVVKGRGWPVIEFCQRRVTVKLKSDQNRVTLGTKRVRISGRFRFEWNAEDANVGSGRWRLVVVMQCESGDDGSPVFVRKRARVRVR